MKSSTLWIAVVVISLVFLLPPGSASAQPPTAKGVFVPPVAIERRMTEAEQRLDRIEQVLGIAKPVVAAPVAAPAVSAAPTAFPVADAGPVWYYQTGNVAAGTCVGGNCSSAPAVGTVAAPGIFGGFFRDRLNRWR